MNLSASSKNLVSKCLIDHNFHEPKIRKVSNYRNSIFTRQAQPYTLIPLFPIPNSLFPIAAAFARTTDPPNKAHKTEAEPAHHFDRSFAPDTPPTTLTLDFGVKGG